MLKGRISAPINPWALGLSGLRDRLTSRFFVLGYKTSTLHKGLVWFATISPASQLTDIPTGKCEHSSQGPLSQTAACVSIQYR